MESESNIFDLLAGLGYDGDDVQQSNDLTEVIDQGQKSLKFRNLVSWITDEIRALNPAVEDQVSKDSDVNDFMLELSGFLKEIKCPFQSLISGPMSDRLQTPESKHILLDYLLTELMALKMNYKLNPKESVVIEISESPAAVALKNISIVLNLGKPPENLSAKVLFDKILSRLDELMQRRDTKKIGKPLYFPWPALTAAQWQTLEQLQQQFDREYDLRRSMLITRLDVTVQSFQWSEKIHGKQDKIAAKYSKNREHLDMLKSGGEATDIVALLAAREDMAIIEKTSSANVRKNTKSDLQKHVIGRVPDRGGRAFEHAPPPPEMPSWIKDRTVSRGGGGGGGRGGGRGGGFQQQPSQQQRPSHQQQNRQQNSNAGGNSRVQGGWSQSGNNNKSFDSNQSFQQNSGGRGSFNRSNSNSSFDSNPNFQQNLGGGGGNYNRGGGGMKQTNNNNGGRSGGAGGGRSNYNRGGGGGPRFFI